jgi:hypothetical protein
MLQSLDAGKSLRPFLASRVSAVRGLAVWGLGLLGDEESLPGLNRLLRDEEVLQLYLDGRLSFFPVGQLAKEAVEGIRRRLTPRTPQGRDEGIRGTPG